MCKYPSAGKCSTSELIDLNSVYSNCKTARKVIKSSCTKPKQKKRRKNTWDCPIIKGFKSDHWQKFNFFFCKIHFYSFFSPFLDTWCFPFWRRVYTKRMKVKFLLSSYIAALCVKMINHENCSKISKYLTKLLYYCTPLQDLKSLSLLHDSLFTDFQIKAVPWADIDYV